MVGILDLSRGRKALDSFWLHAGLMFALAFILVVVVPWLSFDVYLFQNYVGLEFLPPALRATWSVSGFYRDHFFVVTPLIFLALWLDGRVQRFLRSRSGGPQAVYWNRGVVIGLVLTIGIVLWALAVPGVQMDESRYLMVN